MSGAAGLAGAMVAFLRWRRASLHRLADGAQVLRLPRGDVEVHDTGGPGPAVLIVHGTPGGYDQALVVAQGLGLRRHRIVAVSRPGYLRTPLASGSTPPEQASLLADVLQALGVPAAAVVGVSGGGPVAVEFALRHPTRCRRLVLIETLLETFTEQQMYAALSPSRRVVTWLAEHAVRYDLVIAAYLLCTPRADPLRAVATAGAHFTRRHVGYDVDMRLFDDVPDYPLERISAPALVIHGTDDTDVPISHARHAAARIPGARLVEVEGADHLGLWRHGAVGRSVRDFLAG